MQARGTIQTMGGNMPMAKPYISEKRHAGLVTDAREVTGGSAVDLTDAGSPLINIRRNRHGADADGSRLFGIGRRLVLAAPAAISAAALTARHGALAETANAPGVTDTEIRIGQTLPYSG